MKSQATAAQLSLGALPLHPLLTPRLTHGRPIACCGGCGGGRLADESTEIKALSEDLRGKLRVLEHSRQAADEAAQ